MLYNNPSLAFSQFLKWTLRVKMVTAIVAEEFEKKKHEELLSCRGQGKMFMMDRARAMRYERMEKRVGWLKKRKP